MILVCVTDQESCDRLIYAGKQLAHNEADNLKVICVRPRTEERWLASDEMEHLFNTAKELQAEMLVFFSDYPADTVAKYIKLHPVKYILVGEPPETENSVFISTIETQCPEISIITLNRSGNLHLVPVSPEFADY